MATHAGMLIAYDTTGNVSGYLDSLVQYDDAGNVLGLVDFATHEAAGGKLTDVWNVPGAKGSGTWPEWLSGASKDFTVELDKGKRIAALVHKTSGHRHERAAIEAAIEAVVPEGGAKDIRHLVGGPDRPLQLDDQGRTKPWTAPERLAGLLVPSTRAYPVTEPGTAPTGTPEPLPLVGQV